MFRLKLIPVAKVANEVAKPKQKFQTKLHTGSKSSKSSNIFWGLKKKMNLMEKIIGEIEMETKWGIFVLFLKFPKSCLEQVGMI